MTKVDVFVSEGCPHCSDLKQEVSQLKEQGKLCCDVNYIPYNSKNKKLFDKHKINNVPTMMCDNKRITLNKLSKFCPIK